jgi:hypothetical protein
MMNGGAGFYAQGQNLQGMQNAYGLPTGQGPYHQGTLNPFSVLLSDDSVLYLTSIV